MFNETQDRKIKEKNFKRCKEFDNELDKTGFYYTYPSFSDQSNKIMDKFFWYFNRTFRAMKVSVS